MGGQAKVNLAVGSVFADEAMRRVDCTDLNLGYGKFLAGSRSFKCSCESQEEGVFIKIELLSNNFTSSQIEVGDR